MSIATKTAEQIADVIIDNSKSSKNAVQICEALQLIPGNKSYRDSVSLVLFFVRQKVGGIHA